MDPIYKKLVEVTSYEIASLAAVNTHLSDSEFKHLVETDLGGQIASALFRKAYGCVPEVSEIEVGSESTQKRVEFGERVAAGIIKGAMLALKQSPQ